MRKFPHRFVAQLHSLTFGRLPQSKVKPDETPPFLEHPPHPYTGLAHHNAFEMSSYPITNPPIIDLSMLFPMPGEKGIPKRRRISILNGQIGQIINHEAVFLKEDPYDELGDFGGLWRLIEKSDPPVFAAAEVPPGLPPKLAPEVPFDVVPPPAEPLEAKPPADVPQVAGVPPANHLLIYNNEVIFNPNGGPIPGTAAWKKERLLERNRVAALKCRQRKKQAQQQLQEEIGEYKAKIRRQEAALASYKALTLHYNKALRRYFAGQGTLEPLRLLVDKNVEDITPEQLAD